MAKSKINSIYSYMCTLDIYIYMGEPLIDGFFVHIYAMPTNLLRGYISYNLRLLGTPFSWLFCITGKRKYVACVSKYNVLFFCHSSFTLCM